MARIGIFIRLALVSCALTVGAASAAQESGDVEQRPSSLDLARSTLALHGSAKLSHLELITLFTSNVRMRALPLQSTTSFRALEFFYSNGRYSGCGDRGVISGRYKIIGDNICVTAQSNHECRAVYRSQHKYYLEIQSSVTHRLDAYPIDIDSVNSSLNCNLRGD